MKKEKSTDKTPRYPTRVGILENNSMNGIVRPDVPGAWEEIFIDRRHLAGAPFGMRVVCEILDAPKDYEMRGRQYYRDESTGIGMAKGRITEVLGEPGSYDAAVKGILTSCGIRAEFPAKVLEKAQDLPAALDEETLALEITRGRVDRRGETIVTIDGEDAKDLDDAVSVQRAENGRVLLGVHIADVSHYVRDRDPIDKEAALRGTSVYLADRVVPMLPTALSNGLCSLHPGAPKLALSAELEISDEGEVLDCRFTESVIQSRERLTYDEVFRMLGPDREVVDRLEPLRGMLELLRETAEKLAAQRDKRGSVDFEVPETKVRLDSNKKVKEVYAEPSTFANAIIEECMIACNEAVARTCAQKNAPFLYRVHEKPDEEKIERFRITARCFGEKVRFSASPKPEEVRAVLLRVREKPYGQALTQLLLRAMSKARYSNRNLGHFGLASGCYCHFTSPIRRYPDLFVHRVLKRVIKSEAFPPSWAEKASVLGEACSDSERRAMQAERDSVAFKTAEYMEDHLGESFEGEVTGIFHAGAFVRLKNTVEGLVPFRSLSDYYEYDEDTMTARGDAEGRTIRIGDVVTVKAEQADRVARRIEFSLDESTLTEAGHPAHVRKKTLKSGRPKNARPVYKKKRR